jgi:hypothetical protein
MGSLIDILLLHLGGQLSSTYQGTLTAHEDALTPKTHNKQFHHARVDLKSQSGAKRDRTGFKKVGKAVKVAKASNLAMGRSAADEQLWVKLWMCGTSE